MSKAKCSKGGTRVLCGFIVLSISSAAKGSRILEAPHALKREPLISQRHRMKFPDLLKGNINLLYSKNTLTSPSPLPSSPCP